jgi:hypothetical protein
MPLIIWIVAVQAAMKAVVKHCNIKKKYPSILYATASQRICLNAA